MSANKVPRFCATCGGKLKIEIPGDRLCSCAFEFGEFSENTRQAMLDSGVRFSAKTLQDAKRGLVGSLKRIEHRGKCGARIEEASRTIRILDPIIEDLCLRYKNCQSVSARQAIEACLRTLRLRVHRFRTEIQHFEETAELCSGICAGCVVSRTCPEAESNG